MNHEVKKIQSFRDLNAWKEGHRLVMDIYAVTKDFPPGEVFGLVAQLRRAAVSVTSKFLIPATILGLLGILVLRTDFVHAQSAPLITSINVNSVSNSSATISFTIDADAGGRVAYDTVSHSQVSQYQNFNPPSPAYTAAASSHSITLNGLTPATTYHYRIEVQNADGTTASADRTFTTQSSGGGGNTLIITNPVADCIDTSCSLNFGTNLAAKVEIRWGPSPVADFNSYPPGNSVAEINFAFGSRTLQITGLTGNTKYYYRMHAVGQAGGDAMTNELDFTTSSNAFDHVFTTGACIDGTPLNTCSVSKKFCTAAGSLVDDCSLCGFNCPSGSTCSAGGLCVGDPPLTGSPYQCNNSSCYTDAGVFIPQAPAGCYASWPRCNANTILKVKKDRGCNLWLTCSTSIQTEPTASGPAENLCLTLAACNSLSQNGQCNKYLPQGQCDNNPVRFCSTNFDCEAGGSCIVPEPGEPTKSLKDLTFQTPEQIGQIADLSGNVIAGLDWIEQGGATILQGHLPFQLMRQIGGDGKIENGDLEQRPPAATPWEPAPPVGAGTAAVTNNFEDNDPSSGPNHILYVSPDVSIPFSGAVSGSFTANPNEFYYAEVRVRADGVTPKIRLQFGFEDYTEFTTKPPAEVVDTFVDVSATSAWQRITLGPIVGMTGPTRVGVVCADLPSCASFQVDDLQVRPILQVNTNPDYVTPACRLFPRSDSPACEYQDEQGIKYKGWRGYCLEHDSQTGTCLSWWPVDIIKGQSNIFGSEKEAGYDGRSPLFLCAESAGNSGVDDDSLWNARDEPELFPANTIADYRIQPIYYPRRGRYCNGNIFQCGLGDNGWTQGTVGPGYGPGNPNAWNARRQSRVTATGIDSTLREADIAGVLWQEGISCIWNVNNSGCNDNQVDVRIPNNKAFQSGNAINFVTADDSNKPYTVYRTTNILDYSPGCQCFGDDRDGNPFNGDDYPAINPDNDIAWVVNGQWDGVVSGLATSVAWAVILFDKDTGLLKEYVLDAYGSNYPNNLIGGGREFDPIFTAWLYLREMCNQVVEVVTPNNENQAFASRVGLLSTTVDTLGYSKATDFDPFGGAVNPEDDPTDPAQWPPMSAETASAEFPAPGQARAGTPYACVGKCETTACYGYWPNGHSANENTCDVAGGLAFCKTENFNYGTVGNNDLQADGMCLGVTPPTGSPATQRGAQLTGAHDPTLVGAGDNAYFGQERIRRLFAKSYNVFHWEYNPLTLSSAYVKQPAAKNWPAPEEICKITAGQSARDVFPEDFCAVPPRIFCPDADVCDPSDGDGYQGLAQFLTGQAGTVTVTGGSGAVGIKFNTEADPEQLPLQTITIDWGDDTQDQIDYGFAPRNDPAKPHIWSHVYTCSGGATCQRKIKIQIADNWGWCNNAKKNGDPNAFDGTPDDDGCTAVVDDWQDTGLSVIIQP